MVGRERRGGPANEVSGTSVSFAHRKATPASEAGRGKLSVHPATALGTAGFVPGAVGRAVVARRLAAPIQE